MPERGLVTEVKPLPSSQTRAPEINQLKAELDIDFSETKDWTPEVEEAQPEGDTEKLAQLMLNPWNIMERAGR